MPILLFNFNLPLALLEVDPLYWRELFVVPELPSDEEDYEPWNEDISCDDA
jgi:hypothetical protein